MHELVHGRAPRGSVDLAKLIEAGLDVLLAALLVVADLAVECLLKLIEQEPIDLCIPKLSDL
jgi:hypothetical protein